MGFQEPEAGVRGLLLEKGKPGMDENRTRGPQRSFGTRFPAEAHMPGRPLTLGWFLRSSASQMFICKAGHGNADRKAPLRHDSAKTGSADLVKIWGRVSGAGRAAASGPCGAAA